MSNCIFFALHRFFTRGGYLLVRKSQFGWWPHLLWSPDLLHVEDYRPPRPRKGMLFPPLLYRGFVRVTHPAKQV